SSASLALSTARSSRSLRGNADIPLVRLRIWNHASRRRRSWSSAAARLRSASGPCRRAHHACDSSSSRRLSLAGDLPRGGACRKAGRGHGLGGLALDERTVVLTSAWRSPIASTYVSISILLRPRVSFAPT